MEPLLLQVKQCQTDTPWGSILAPADGILSARFGCFHCAKGQVKSIQPLRSLTLAARTPSCCRTVRRLPLSKLIPPTFFAYLFSNLDTLIHALHGTAESRRLFAWCYGVAKPVKIIAESGGEAQQIVYVGGVTAPLDYSRLHSPTTPARTQNCQA